MCDLLWNNGDCNYSEIRVVDENNNDVYQKIDRTALDAIGARDLDSEY